MKRILILPLLLLLVAGNLNAQHHHPGPCLTDHLYFDEYLKNNPEAEQRMLDAMEHFEQYQKNPTLSKKKNVYRIPVVFHVVHQYGDENISKEQIEDQIRVLNEDFRRMNADAVNTRAVFQSVAADTEIEFVLAKKDPQGNCTEGIVRVFSDKTNNARDNMKSVSYWPSDKYLNVWVVKSIQNSSDDEGVITLGYAQFPWDRATKPTTDGIVLRADYVGTIGTSNTAKGGRTATHEVGHWLGLFHTFQGGCGTPQWGEKIADTPPVEEPSFGCNPNANTCNNDNPDLVDQIENYMDYSNGNCQNMFTNGQKVLMHSMIDTYRAVLVSPGNATNSGIDLPSNTCAPKADFENTVQTLCQGSSVSFKDLSYNGQVSSRTWTFQGGTPATSTDANPTVTYANAGVYQVKLEVSNGTGSTELIRDSVVLVRPTISSFGAPFKESFETTTFAPSQWMIGKPDGYSWNRVTGVGKDGNACARAFINSNTLDGAVFELYTPPFDLNAIGDPVLTFEAAYARNASTATDRIRVFASTDCGQSWVMLYQRGGSQLETGPVGTTNFVPTSSQWKMHTVLLGNYVGRRNLLIRFDAISGQGGTIYLDDINIGSVSGVENTASSIGMQVFPNPSNGNASLRFDLLQDAPVNIWITDISGKRVVAVKENEQLSGSQEIPLQVAGLKAGIYFIQVEIDGQRYTQRLVLSY